MFPQARKTSKEPMQRRASKEMPTGRRGSKEQSGRGTKEPSGRTGRRTSVFEQSVQIAKAHAIPLDEVQRAHTEFVGIDQDCDGKLQKDEFLQVLRRRLGLAPHETCPAAHAKRAWLMADLNCDGVIDFEEFVLWDHSNAFSEELILDGMDRRLREVSRKHGLQIDVVEEVKRVFDRYDCDNSGGIDREEFKKLLATLLGCKDAFDVPQERLERYWREADPRQTGTIDLEGFVLFYTKNFQGQTEVGGRGTIYQYNSLGRNRFAR
jgi:Ca2+-binding EF-hand superfamily protein